MGASKLPTDQKGAKLSFPFWHWDQNTVLGQAVELRLGSIIARSFCCVQNYTLMMYFHATVPRKWLGNSDSSMGERVRHVNIWKKRRMGEGKVFLSEALFCPLQTELKNAGIKFSERWIQCFWHAVQLRSRGIFSLGIISNRVLAIFFFPNCFDSYTLINTTLTLKCTRQQKQQIFICLEKSKNNNHLSFSFPFFPFLSLLSFSFLTF